MISEFKLESNINENVGFIKTHGYINNVGGESIVNEFNKLSSDGAKNIVLNLADTKVVNSIGISFLIEIIEKLNDNGGKLVFTNLDPTIEKTFTIMGLFHFAEKADSDEAAASKF
jgi:anti-anti-sigma factor